MVDIELSGSGGEGGASAPSSSEVEVQDTDAIDVGSSVAEVDSSKRSAKVLATPAVR